MTDTTITKAEVESLLDQSYNQGIDNAMALVKVYGDSHWKLVEPSLMAEDLIKQLESLKK